MCNKTINDRRHRFLEALKQLKQSLGQLSIRKCFLKHLSESSNLIEQELIVKITDKRLTKTVSREILNVIEEDVSLFYDSDAGLVGELIDEFVKSTHSVYTGESRDFILRLVEALKESINNEIDI